MFKKLDSVKALKTLIKLAAVALTSPATVSVASGLYPTDPITKVVVSIAALILIEGCLLLGWQMLDRQGKNSTGGQRWLYAGLAWVAYFSLFGIALYHKEGVAGLVFRLTLGVMLIYASAEAGLLAELRARDQADRDILKDWKVRRYALKLSRRSAMADLDTDDRMRQTDREAREKLYSLQKELETERQIKAVQLRWAFDNQEGVEMAKSDNAAGSLERANQKRKLSKRQALDRTLQILSANSTASPSEIAAQIGKSRQTVYDYFKELEATRRLHGNGSGVQVIGSQDYLE